MSIKFIENYKLLAITSKNSFSSDISGNDQIYYSENLSLHSYLNFKNIKISVGKKNIGILKIKN